MKRQDDRDLEKALAAIRDEKIDNQAAEAAANRVRANLGLGSAQAAPEHLRACSDFRALIPAYLESGLPEARRLLFEDHVHECVACRRAVETARGEVRVVRMPQQPGKTATYRRWAVAAAVVLAAGAGTAIVLPPPGGVRATVESGAAYLVSATGVSPLASGAQLRERDRVRTGRSTAVLRLADGSLVEMDARTQVEVTRGWLGADIRLDRGNVIVEAAKQHWGRRLTVSTTDAHVTVHGTVFEVSESAAGSRVSVVEGEVQVDHARKSTLLHRGDQTTTNSAMSPTAVAEEVAWSRNSAKYMALLGDLRTLANQIEALPAQSLRHQSRLAAYLPENTAVFIAIPNVGRTLVDASALIRDRLRESEAMREWWAKENGAQFDTLMEKVRAVSDYVGDEIVVSFAAGAKAPLILAELRKPGLREYLASQTESADKLRRSVVESNGIIAIAPAPEMASVMPRLEGPGSGAFQGTPFWKAIAPSYQTGAGWLLCADLEQLLRSNVTHKEIPQRTGIEDVRYLIIERKQVDGQTEDRATLSFAAERHGIPSWLGAPGPVGSLEYFSPDSAVAGGLVLKNPKALMEDFFGMLAQKEPEFQSRLAEIESKLGVRIIDDLAASLGSDAAFGIDGPMLPKPSVKLVIETYNPERVQWAIERIVEAANREKAGMVALTPEQVGSRTFYTLRPAESPVEIHYTFSDGYLIAAASRDLVEKAIQNKQAGYSLPRSNAFRDQLPRDRYSDYSAVLYQNLTSSVAPVVETLSASGAMTPEQQKSAQALVADRKPGALFAYGEPSRIVLASRGGLFGLHLDQIMAMQAGQLGSVAHHHSQKPHTAERE